MAKFINIITFLYFSIPQMTQKGLKAMIFKIFTPCGMVGGIYPSTLTTIKFQHPSNIIFFFQKNVLFIKL